MIILTQSQADNVRGDTANGARLEPIRLKSGKYVLPEEVLSDPAHAAHHAFLKELPVRAITDDEWVREAE